MATPVPPDITVKLYQLEENGGGTDLQKKASPVEVSYSTGDVTTNDFNVVSISDLGESIEIDKGVYQIDGLSLVSSGLSETFFNSYVDPLNEPYVCEIYDTNAAAVIFHGPIDRASIRYNPGTGYTSFDVQSWLYVLEQTTAAARYIYDTKMTRRYDGQWEDSYRAVFIAKTINGLDMSTVVQSGDIAVFEAGGGEHRTPILAPVADGTDLVLTILAPPSNFYVADVTVTPTADFNVNLKQYLRMDIVDATLYTALSRFHSNPDDPEYDGDKINIFVSPNGGTHSGEIHYATIDSDPKEFDVSGRQYYSNNYWRLDPDGVTVVLSFEPGDQPWVADAVANGVDVDVGGASSKVDTGNKIRILGREVYGYVETAGFDEITAKMRVQKIIEGMFGLDDLGVMQYVVDTFTYPVGWDPEWDKWLEYPNKLIDSLRMIQDTESVFVKFKSTLDGSSLPRMTLEVIPRGEANTTDRGAATALTGIIKYSEESANRTPRAVVVKPKHNYLLPKTWNHVDHKGFYYDSMPTTAVLIASAIVPEGADVLEVTANWTPSYSDTKLWPTNGKSVMLDPLGKNIARRFYEFYENLNRVATFTYDGAIDIDTIGNFVSINEGGLARTIFVTSLKQGIVKNETEVTGLVGEYTDTPSGDPVSVVDGAVRYVDTDSGGDEDISLSGQRSYDPNGLTLTYEWILDPTGTPSTIGTDAFLNDYTLAVGTHTIRLTVDNGTTTDSTDVTVKVIDPVTTTPEADPEANFQGAPMLMIDAAGDVFISIIGDYLTDPASDGVRIDYSLTASTGPWTPGVDDPYTNPVIVGGVYTGLAEDADIWVRVQLVNFSDGSISYNEWIGQITNVIGSTVDTTTIDALLNLDGSFDMDGAASDFFSVVINSNTYIELDDAGNMDLYGGNNLMATLDASGFAITLPAGDVFQVDVNSVDMMLIDSNGVTIQNDLIHEDQANGQQLLVKSATTELTGLSGATATATNLIPAGSCVLGVTARVTTTITGAATDFDIGDGTTQNLFGNAIGLAAGTTTDLADHIMTTPKNYFTNTSVVLTSGGPDFTAGAVRLTVHYIDLVAATS